MDLLAGESVIWAGHPTWRATLSMIIKGILTGLAVAVAGIVISSLGGGGRWSVYGVLLGLAIAVGTVAASWIKRRFTEYTITDKRLNVRWGVLSKRETTTSVDRIQNLTITQTVIDRILKTGSIDFDTASDTSDEKFRFVGVNDPQGLRQRINAVRIEGHPPAARADGL